MNSSYRFERSGDKELTELKVNDLQILSFVYGSLTSTKSLVSTYILVLVEVGLNTEASYLTYTVEDTWLN